MLWWASASLRLGDVDLSRFSGRGWGLEMEVEMKREEDWLCRRQGSHMFVYLSIVPFSRFMPSLTHSLFSWWLTDTVWHTNTHTSMHTPSFVHQLVHREDETNQGQKHTRSWDQCCFSLNNVNSNLIYNFEFILKSKNPFKSFYVKDLLTSPLVKGLNQFQRNFCILFLFIFVFFSPLVSVRQMPGCLVFVTVCRTNVLSLMNPAKLSSWMSWKQVLSKEEQK